MSETPTSMEAAISMEVATKPEDILITVVATLPAIRITGSITMVVVRNIMKAAVNHSAAVIPVIGVNASVIKPMTHRVFAAAGL